MNNFEELLEANGTQQKKTIYFFWYYNTGYPEGTGRNKWSRYKPNLHVDLLNELTREIGHVPSGLDIDTTFVREEGGGVIRAKVKLNADASWIREVENSNITDQKSPIVTQQHVNLRNQQTQQRTQFSKDHIQQSKDTLTRRILGRKNHPKNQPYQPQTQDTGRGFWPDHSKGTRDSFVAGMKIHDVKMTFNDKENKEIIIWNDYDSREGWGSFEPFLNFISVRLTEVGFAQTRTSSSQRWFEKKPLEKAILRIFKSRNKLQLNFHTLGEPDYTKQDNKYKQNQRYFSKRKLKENNFQLQLESIKE